MTVESPVAGTAAVTPDAATPLARDTVLHPRGVERQVQGTVTSDGAGVRLTRVFSQSLQRRLDPFLMLDAFGSDEPDHYIAGFPDHPHRGFETITYLTAGRMRHRDSAGHEGLLASGGAQWMTAGRGVIHSEMPEQEDGLLAGFQLWLNLASGDKMCAPWYRDIQSADIPEFTTADGAHGRLLAGHSHGHTGAVMRERTEPLYVDVHLTAGGKFAQAIADTYTAFAYVYQGEVRIGDARVPAGRLAILDNTAGSDGVRLEADSAARVLLIAGRPLNEAIVQYGPFVMNTHEEIEQAIHDYRRGHLVD